MSASRRPHQPARRQFLLGAAGFGAASLLSACGGGGSTAGTTSAGLGNGPAGLTAASFASGPITGFGSIFVGGVRFDDTAALVLGDDGSSHGRDALKLGVVVEVEGGQIDRAAASGVALRVVLGHSLLGPVNAVDVAGSTLTLLGQTVVVNADTLFDVSITGGLAGITAGNILEVHALYDAATKRFAATRIEVATAPTEYRLRGEVSALDTTAKTFKIGSETISYGSLATPPSATALVNGAFVRVSLQTTQVASAWVATRLRIGMRSLEVRNAEAEVEGVITAFTSLQSFEVNGMKVDATNAAFPAGSTGVVLGARIEVSGTVVDGVLVAAKVVPDLPRPERARYEFRGAVANLDTVNKTFSLRGMTIWYGGTVTYKNGTEATLADGKSVEVKGELAADRTRIEARLIEFK